MAGQPGQGHASTAASPRFNAKAARAKLMSRDGRGDRPVRVRPRRRARTTARTTTTRWPASPATFSWTTSCGGCHLPIEANWKTTSHNYEGERPATSPPTTRRSRATTCSSSAGTRPPRATIIAPVRSTSALVLSLDQHQPRADLRPAAADQRDRLLEPGLRAALPAHGAHDRDQDLLRLPPVATANDNNAIMAQLLLLGTNFVNFVGLQRLGRPRRRLPGDRG